MASMIILNKTEIHPGQYIATRKLHKSSTLLRKTLHGTYTDKHHHKTMTTLSLIHNKMQTTANKAKFQYSSLEADAI